MKVFSCTRNVSLFTLKTSLCLVFFKNSPFFEKNLANLENVLTDTFWSAFVNQRVEVKRMPATLKMHCNDDPPLKLVFFPLHCFSDRKHYFPARWLQQARPSKLPLRYRYRAPDSDLLAFRLQGRRGCCVRRWQGQQQAQPLHLCLYSSPWIKNPASAWVTSCACDHL